MARDTQYTLYKTGRTDPTFKNIWAFSSREERDIWLSTCSEYPIMHNKYWRVGSSIKIPVRYEESFNYDYVRIVNRVENATATKTWFCFVTARNYISNNCTLLTLAVDYVQTFYFSVALDGGEYPFWQVDGFISKATNNMIPPRGTPSEFPTPEVDCFNLYFNATGFSVVIYSSVDIRDLSSLKYTTAIIDGQYTASPPYVMKADVAAISKLINDVNTAGYTDAISGIYLIPNDYINLSSLTSSPLLATDSSIYRTVQRTVTQPTSCAGYIPKNKELLGYDYSYFTINNGQGEISTWHFEDFSGTPTFNARLSLASGSPVLIMYPANYINTDQNDFRQLSVKVTQAPACSYLNDSYKIWLAQTQNSRAAAVNGANLAVSQAKEARDLSLSYKVYKTGNPILDYIKDNDREALQGAYKTFRGLKEAATRNPLSNILNTVAPSSPSYWGLPVKTLNPSMTDKFGGGSSAGSGAGRSFGGGVNVGALIDNYVDLADLYVRKQLGIENAFIYDQNVASAQANLDKLLAGYSDRSRVPATAVGSNAYGDVCFLQQYGFMIAVYTPTAFYAEWIDKQISASGHAVNAYAYVNRVHTVFDYFEVPSPYIPAERNGRPQYARNMLVSLMAQGVYLWYVNNGDISDHIGVPYGLDNPPIA